MDIGRKNHIDELFHNKNKISSVNIAKEIFDDEFLRKVTV